MVETSSVVHLIIHRKISKKVGKLPVPGKIMRMKITQTGLYIQLNKKENWNDHPN